MPLGLTPLLKSRHCHLFREVWDEPDSIGDYRADVGRANRLPRRAGQPSLQGGRHSEHVNQVRFIGWALSLFPRPGRSDLLYHQSGFFGRLS
jgi:hypothetical protein